MTVFLTAYQFALDLYRHMGLTAIQVKEAKPSDKDHKLSDGEGMYLLVKKNGNNTSAPTKIILKAVWQVFCAVR